MSQTRTEWYVPAVWSGCRLSAEWEYKMWCHIFRPAWFCLCYLVSFYFPPNQALVYIYIYFNTYAGCKLLFLNEPYPSRYSVLWLNCYEINALDLFWRNRYPFKKRTKLRVYSCLLTQGVKSGHNFNDGLWFTLHLRIGCDWTL